MAENILRQKDNLVALDKCFSSDVPGKSVFKKTRVIGGYDPYVDKSGVTRFGEVLFDQENMVELGGALFTLERLFGVESSLNIQNLEDIIPNIKKVDELEFSKSLLANSTICLFGVGIGGCGESMTDVKDVKFYERELVDMIPFRQTENDLSHDDKERYWFRKNVVVEGVGKTAYYLKRFETDPVIKVLWKDNPDPNEDGSEVGDDVYNTDTSNTTDIETFVEMTLKITKKDVREYFTDNGNIEYARINTFGLFTGVKHKISETPEEYDYRGVRLFSKLNIYNEMLALSKDLTIIYRIYLS